MICGILLAAGAAERFGADKLATPLADGRAVAVAAAAALDQGVDRLLAVVRDAGSASACLLRAAGVELSVCPHAARGMGASLAWGVTRTAQASGWVIGLADMPRVQGQTVRALVERLRAGSAIVVPHFHGRPGNPVAFGRALGGELARLDADHGGRAIIRAHAGAVDRLAVADSGILMDIDRPGDVVKIDKKVKLY